MKKLNKAQHYGLLAFFGGFALHIILAIFLPSLKILSIAAWCVAFIGIIIYIIGTIPDIREWLNKLINKYYNLQKIKGSDNSR